MRAVPRACAALALLATTLALSACEDLRDYAGAWSGALSPDPNLAYGFSPGSTITAAVSSVTRAEIALSLSVTQVAGPTAPAGPVVPGPALPFLPIRKAAGDILADVQLPGEPLRTYFGFVEPPGETPLLTVVSLYPENRMEIRLIRGPDQGYGVFYLRRVLSEPPANVAK
jgi:hypothetical protein